MHLSLLTTSLLSLALCTSTALAKTPILKPAFTAKVDLGKPIGPVPVDGGVTVVEPITGGKISGPLFNGKIVSGQAAVTVTSNGTIHSPNVQIFGLADDESPFIVTGTGIGQPGSQVARVIVEVGGKYTKRADEFIVATFTDNDKNPPTMSSIEGWIVVRSD